MNEDRDVEILRPTALRDDLECTNLRVASTLYTNGRRIYVRDTLTIVRGGKALGGPCGFFRRLWERLRYAWRSLWNENYLG